MKPIESSTHEHSAFVSNSTNFQGCGDHGHDHDRGLRSRDQPRCSHCNKLGHIKEKYWDLHGRPTEQFKANIVNASKEASSQISLKKLFELLDTYDKIKSSFISLKSRKSASTYLVDLSLSMQIIDTSAIDRMTRSSISLSSMQPVVGKHLIILADGSKTPVYGIDHADISFFIDLLSESHSALFMSIDFQPIYHVSIDSHSSFFSHFLVSFAYPRLGTDGQ